MEHLKEALYCLVLLSEERDLTKQENDFYVYCVDTLNDAGEEIPFGIEI